MPVRKLKRFLDENEVEFVAVSHSRAFTAQEIAASAHAPGVAGSTRRIFLTASSLGGVARRASPATDRIMARPST